jgi:hypothetical protein
VLRRNQPEATIPADSSYGHADYSTCFVGRLPPVRHSGHAATVGQLANGSV